MAENKNAVSFDELALFKALQDLFNANTFQKKGESDLAGALRYDAPQVLTDPERAQAIANLGLTLNGGSDNVVIVRGAYSVDGTTEYVSITEETAATIKANLYSGKPMFLWLDNYTWWFYARNGNFTQLVNTAANTQCYNYFNYVDGQTQFLMHTAKLLQLGEDGKIDPKYLPDGINLDTDVLWENIEGKPFYKEGWEVTWDGDTSNVLADPYPVEDMGATLYKISNETKTKEEVIGATTKALYNEDEINTNVVSSEEIQPTDSENCFVVFDGGVGLFIVVLQDGTYTFMGIEFVLTQGIWAAVPDSYTPIYLGKVTYKTLEEEYIPDTVVKVDKNGLIPASLLPSYVDDAVEGKLVNGVFNTVDDSYITPESGKIYVDINTGNTYRWSGSQYVQLNPPEITFATSDDIRALFNTN